MSEYGLRLFWQVPKVKNLTSSTNLHWGEGNRVGLCKPTCTSIKSVLVAVNGFATPFQFTAVYKILENSVRTAFWVSRVKMQFISRGGW